MAVIVVFDLSRKRSESTHYVIMNLSFHSGVAGVSAHQTKMDVVANNIANINTTGYKTKTTHFSDLLYANIRPEHELISPKLRQNAGTKVNMTDALWESGGFEESGRDLDFFINGEGFFAVLNPQTEETVYTRDGAFHLALMEDGSYNLASSWGGFILDKQNQVINMTAEEVDNAKDGIYFDHDRLGIFDFVNKQGMEHLGNNTYRNDDTVFLTEDVMVIHKHLEMSNVSLAKEITDMIRAQRTYQMNLRMMTTSDEIENTIIGLRQ